MTKRSSGTSSARRPRARARGTCRGRRARAGRSGSGASRSSGRGSRPGSRSARRPRSASAAGSARAARTDATSASSSSSRSGCGGSGAAQTANTIGRPVRSSQSRPRSWCGVGSSNADLSAASPISSFASASSPSGTCSASGSSTFVSTTDVADSGVTATVRMRSSGVDETSWIESTAPSDETQSRGSSSSDVGVARVLDRRDRRGVELAGDEAAVELGRDADDLLELGVDAEEDRRHVGVRDAAEADHAQLAPVAPCRQAVERVLRAMSLFGGVGIPTSRPYADRGYRRNRHVSVTDCDNCNDSPQGTRRATASRAAGHHASHRRSSL